MKTKRKQTQFYRLNGTDKHGKNFEVVYEYTIHRNIPITKEKVLNQALRNGITSKGVNKLIHTMTPTSYEELYSYLRKK
jgi:thiamine pyrophosphate-dependent acetolactate synthase large subunit-like protein